MTAARLFLAHCLIWLLTLATPALGHLSADGNAANVSQGASVARSAVTYNRQLHIREAELIERYADEFAAEQEISVEEAKALLTWAALFRTDSLMAEQFVFDAPPEAVDFLERLGMGTDIEGTDQQYFQASDTQRNTHQLNARYLLETRALYNTTSAGLEGRVAVPMGDVFALAFASTHATQGLPSPEDMRALQDAFVHSDDGVKTDVISQIMLQPEYSGFSSAAVQQLSIIADMSQADMQIRYAGGTIAASVAGMEVLGSIAEKWNAGEPLTEDELIVRDAIMSMGAAAKLNGGAIMFSRLARLPAFQRVVAANRGAGGLDRLPCCFVAGTPIKTETGYTNIEQLEVGDWVLAQDVETGDISRQQVTDVHVRPITEIKTFYRLSVVAGEVSEDLYVTGEHPFWVPSQQEWVTVDELVAGTELTNFAGDVVRLVEKELQTELQQTYNITVEGFASYFAGLTETLVHNCGEVVGRTANGQPIHAVARDGGTDLFVQSPSGKYIDAQRYDLATGMGKPTASNPDLQRIVDYNYRQNATVGSGSTADAVRQEIVTGVPVGNVSGHSIKAQQQIIRLNNWISNNPGASPGDIRTAQNMVIDMEDALATPRP